MKKLLFYLLFAIYSLSATAQVNVNDLIIQGTVTNANTNSPVGGWPVTITGMGMTSQVFTNESGFFIDTIFGGSQIGPNQLFVVETINCDSSTVIQTVSNNQGTVDDATVNFQISCGTPIECSAPISMTIMNGNMYRFYTDTVPGIQSYAWVVTTFEDDTATSSGSFSSTPSAYFSGNQFFSPDYVEACLTLTFADGCVANSCDTFVYCDAGFTYTLNDQYALTLTPDFPAGYMNELHYWTVSGPGIPNPTQNTEIATYYLEPGATYNVCQQLMITSSGCNTSECQVITIPDTEAPVCDAAFTYYYQPTNAYLSVNSPYTNAQGSFQHTWEVTSYMNNGTINTNNQLNVNNNSMFVASNTNALEICHTLTNLNTGCVDSSCQYLDFCSSAYTYAIDTNNQVMTLTAGGVQTLATHTWNIAYHAAGGVYNSEILSGPVATFLLPDGILDMTVCHSVNNTGPYVNCSSYTCDTIVFCNAEFTVIDNGNGTAGIWAVSPPIDGAVYTWSITGPGYAGTAYSGSYFNFTPVPNEPYYVCMAYFNAETGCSASNCDTIVIEGISDTCSAEFTYTYNNNVLLAQASTPYFSGNMYSWTAQSSVYGTLANIQDSGPYTTITIPSDAGTVYICLNLTNDFYGCNSSFCDTLIVSPDTSCTAEIVMGYAPDGWPMFSANGNSTIASYSWVLTPYDSNGEAAGTGFYSTQSNSYIPSGVAYAYIEACLAITTASGCAWNGCNTFTAPPDTSNTLPCNAIFTFTGPLPVDNNYQFIGVTNEESAYHVWTFSDGASSSQVSPFHTFETTGEYTVCHIVGINGVCADTVCYTGNFIGNSATGLFIAGEVNAGANVPDNGKVKLYTIDTLSNSVSLVAEYTLSNSGNYMFNGLEAGIYLIKAGLTQGSAWYGDYVPTYFGSQFYWFDAEPVYLTQSGENYDIALIYAGNGGGPGSVGGNIDDGPFRLMDPESAGVANANPVAGADVIVTDLNGNPQRWMDADDNGNFNITNLAYGTYRLLADEPGMTCVPIEFTISPDFPSVYIELVMGDELTGTETLNSTIQIGNVYPNPTANQAQIKINGTHKEAITLDVLGLDGRLYQSEIISAQNQNIGLEQLPSGIYQLRVSNASGSVLSVQKLSVVK
ncbi:MAG: T9SS type A sorting domain-containing protein [Bacteroidia bacterium]